MDLGRRATWCACAAISALCAAVAQSQPKLEAAFDQNGLCALTCAGDSFLQDGTFRVWGATLRTWDGQSRPADLSGEKREFRAADHQFVLTYGWATVRCTYALQPDRLRLTIEVTNRSEAVLSEIALCPMESRFPQPPRGWVPHMPYRAFNLGWPTSIPAVCSKATVVICNEDIGRPLRVGWAGRESLAARPMIVATASDWAPELVNPQIARPIYPGQSDRFEITLRFAPASPDSSSIAADLTRRFVEAHPHRLVWKDRRPVGALFLSSSQLGAPKNPRGWFNDKETDYTGEAGAKRFRDRLMEYAQRSAAIIKGFGGQGMITWDIEGQEYPHATSYLGDPRSLPAEMEPAADAYFKVFSDAGLRTGICVRPQIPVRSAYGDGVRQIESADVFANLDAKITYAEKRWGCTLFYVDSNGDPNVPMPAAIFEGLRVKHPNALLIPEHENAQYYASTAPYRDYANLKELGTPETVRGIYPDAFCFVYVGHGDPAAARADLLDAVRHGDILAVHGWYDSPSHAVVKQIYAEAGRK